MYIKHEGYLINKALVDKLLNKPSTLALKNKLVEIGDGEKVDKELGLEACVFIEQLTPVELCLFALMNNTCKGLVHLASLISNCCISTIMEMAYHDTVTGVAPYPYAQELGLTEQEIKEYQDEWRKIGIDPTLLEWVAE
jgi:hypothetical protein